jgi:ADP-ribose pyrophosphatase
MDSWPKVGDDEVIKVGWRRLVKKTFIDESGAKVEYMTQGLIGKNAAAVIALTSDNQVIIAEQFRPGPEKIMQELPGGGVEAGEDEKQAVARELLEETGYQAGEIEFLGVVLKDAYTNTQWHFYFARDCVDTGQQHLDDGEFVRVKLISIDQLFENAKNAQMTDVSAVYLAYEKLKAIMDGAS